MEQVTVTGYDEQGNKFTRKSYQPRGGSGKGSSGGGKGKPNPMNGGGSKQNGGKGRKRNPMG
jgi:hypothetical protein